MLLFINVRMYLLAR